MHTQMVNVVEQRVFDKMMAQESFTALDISNTLKADRWPFRHREVAEIVRDIYDCGAMRRYGYARNLIPVAAGANLTHAYLYCHKSGDPDWYAERDQQALRPVPAHEARDVADSVSSTPLGLLLQPASVARSRSMQGRLDGALAIPRRLIALLGWTTGSHLNLQAEPGRIILSTTNPTSEKTVQVWREQRVRISKTKLRLGALSADIADIRVEGDSLHIEVKE